MGLTQWMDLIVANPVLMLVFGVFVVLAASWLAGRRQMQERGRQFLAQIDDSTVAHAAIDAPVSAGGFIATLLPAPEPYDHCSVRYQTSADLNPFVWLTQLIAPAPEHLVIHATLPSPPGSELVWDRGQSPPTALGLHPGRELWSRRRLDTVDAEYATRGDITNGVQHVFAELQSRFGPFLRRIIVSAESEPHIIVILSTERFDPVQTPVLIALVRSLGRAATIE